MPAWRPLRPSSTCGRLRLVHLIVGVAVVALLLALVLRAWDGYPEANRRRESVRLHEVKAESWNSAADAIAARDDLGDRPPHYRWVAANPTWILADRRRFDAMGRTDGYAYGCHLWLGPHEIRDREPAIRDDLVAVCRERARYHLRMRDKWSLAARMPWSSVEEDSPGPPLVYAPTGDSY
jgi:hypothetical protein